MKLQSERSDGEFSSTLSERHESSEDVPLITTGPEVPIVLMGMILPQRILGTLGVAKQTLRAVPKSPEKTYEASERARPEPEPAPWISTIKPPNDHTGTTNKPPDGPVTVHTGRPGQ